MTNIGALLTSSRLLAATQTRSAPVRILTPIVPPRPTAFINATHTQAQAAAAALALETRAASGASASIVLQKSGGSYEMTGSKTVSVGAGVSAASETVELKAGASYTVATSFGLNSTRGRMKLELLDSSGKIVQTVMGGVGKTSANVTYKAAATGVFTIRLTGQPLPDKSATAFHQSYSIGVAQALSKIPTSGDKNIDALVYGGTHSWLHDAGALATASTNVVKTGVRSLNPAMTRSVKYAFMTSDSIKTLTGQDARGAAAMSDVQKAAVNDAFAYLGSVIALRFEAVSDPAQADILFGQNNQGGTSAGYANPPNQSGSHAQYLFLASDQATNSNFANGSYGLTTLLHEIGHTLGLKHPGNYNAGGGGAPGPYLPKDTDNRRFTLMSYYGAPDVSSHPQTLMGYDVLALQFLYGANSNPTDTAALAKRQTTNFEDSWRGLETIWAPKGAELDASRTTRSNIVDFREGAYSSIAMSGSMANNNVGLAWGSKLTSAKGGSGADRFYTAFTGDVVADGGAGVDTLYLAGKASEWSRSGETYTRKVAGQAVSNVTAHNFETVAYYDAAKAPATHA